MSTINVTVGGTTITSTVSGITINVTVSNTVSIAFVNSDTTFKFDGASGDTYLKYNSSTNRLELVVDGNKEMEWG